MYGIVGVYTGALGSLTQVGASGQGQQCASLGNNLAGTQVTFAATAGTVYHVDVTGHGGAQGSFYLQGLLRTGKSAGLARHRGGSARLPRERGQRPFRRPR